MERYLSEIFNVDVVECLGGSGNGYINDGASYLVGDEKMFVKSNLKSGVRQCCIDLIRSVCFAIVQVEMLNISRLADGNFCLTLETYRLGPLIIGDGCS